ncbi:MAG: carboxymuconolactone decarboxylase family protein [Planctomycetes bacterium]|nr:carboxymuconolactone decarboxylase family protein [Planctomycetota bacterium]MCB9872066.1 carboxymuconolactone decarboxylase family protein [Planctomycetota bacterium]
MDNKQDADAPNQQPILDDSRIPSSQMRSYALMTPEVKKAYMNFYKTTYVDGKLDLLVKEFIAIGASLALGCKGCLEGHMKKAKKLGATNEQISEVVAVTCGVAGASIVDRSDIANHNLGDIFHMDI